jgi:hypothetical protein
VRYTRKKLPFALPKGGVKRASWDMSSFKTTNLAGSFLEETVQQLLETLSQSFLQKTGGMKLPQRGIHFQMHF